MPSINISKRKKVMQRSIKLGHCICDPKRPCPCTVFTEQGICPCAGERPDPIDLTKVKLTEMVHNAGCASKISASDLERFLSRLPEVNDPDIISGLPSGDDAGIYRLNKDTTIVQTVDVFTPCVDDPYQFGKICAANCLSDIYAMGGIPKTALGILCFPSETQDGQIMYLMMKGAMDMLEEAHCSLIGGHSIKDEEIKLGFAITGIIDASKAVELESARCGDKLVLTKPLGVGVLNFARQIKRINESGLKAAENSMMTLNKSACEAMNEVGVSACTDITGFGLFGHLIRMARHSGVTMRVYADSLPAFDGALDFFREGIIPGAVERNSEFVGDDLIVTGDIDDAYKNLGFDAQTSGGLLITVPEERYQLLIDALKKRGLQPFTIGEIVNTSEGLIELVASDKMNTGDGDAVNVKQVVVDQPTAQHKSPENVVDVENHGSGCCSDVFGTSEEKSEKTGSAASSMKAFGDLMRSVGVSGKIDEKTKELINFSLVVLSRCEPCIDMHFEKAAALNISREELDEAAWCAISMGGAPVKMFYSNYLKSKGM